MRLPYVFALIAAAGLVLCFVFLRNREFPSDRISSGRSGATDGISGFGATDGASSAADPRTASGPLRVVVLHRGRPLSGAKIYVDGEFRGESSASGLALNDAHGGVMLIRAAYGEWRGVRRSAARSGTVRVQLAHLARNELVGTVVDLEGTPVPGVVVRSETGDSTTGADGRFSLPTAGQGAERVRLMLDGLLFAVREVWVGVDAELRVRPPLTVELVVENADGTPLDADIEGSGRLAGSHAFSIPRMRAERAKGGTAALAIPHESSISVAVRAAGYVTRRLDLVARKLKDGQAIRVVLETGRPLTLFIDDAAYAGQSLWVGVGRHAADWRIIDLEGRVRFDGQAESGLATISVTIEPKRGGGRFYLPMCQLQLGNRRTHTLEAPALHRVVLRCVTADGRPLQRCAVRVEGSPRGAMGALVSSGSLVCDDAGELEILVPGDRYRVVAGEPPRAEQSIEVSGPTQATIEAPAGADCMLRVRYPSGEPVAERIVRLDNGSSRWHFISNTRGEVALRDVPEGRYDCLVEGEYGLVAGARELLLVRSGPPLELSVPTPGQLLVEGGPWPADALITIARAGERYLPTGGVARGFQLRFRLAEQREFELSEGPYRIRVDAADCVFHATSADIISGLPVKVAPKLHPGGYLEIQGTRERHMCRVIPLGEGNVIERQLNEDGFTIGPVPTGEYRVIVYRTHEEKEVRVTDRVVTVRASIVTRVE